MFPFWVYVLNRMPRVLQSWLCVDNYILKLKPDFNRESPQVINTPGGIYFPANRNEITVLAANQNKQSD